MHVIWNVVMNENKNGEWVICRWFTVAVCCQFFLSVWFVSALCCVCVCAFCFSFGRTVGRSLVLDCVFFPPYSHIFVWTYFLGFSLHSSPLLNFQVMVDFVALRSISIPSSLSHSLSLTPAHSHMCGCFVSRSFLNWIFFFSVKFYFTCASRAYVLY